MAKGKPPPFKSKKMDKKGPPTAKGGDDTKSSLPPWMKNKKK